MPTPYQQRFDYYQAARDHLVSQYHAILEVKNLKQAFDDLPKYPSTDEIFLLAEEIKAFAEKK